MFKPTYFDAVQNLTNNKGLYGTTDGPLSKITLEKGVVSPTEEAIQTKLAEMLAEYDAQEYARNRQAEYPAIADQLDEIYHNGINAWKAVIKVTKDKYPKG